MEIVFKKTEDLIPYVNNTRTHSNDQVQQIASSIKEFGFTNPILLDENNGIVAGHGRLMGAKLLNFDEVPTITLKGLSEAQIKAYVIADNKIALNSEWDMDLLKIEFQSLEDMGYDLELTGFDEIEINDVALFTDDEVEVEDDFFDDEETSSQDLIKLSVTCDNDMDKQQLKEELLSRGFLCQ